MGKDILVKAVTKNGYMRIYAVDSREAVEKARAVHDLSPVSAAALGRCISAGLMMGAMLKGRDDSITVNFKGGGAIGSVLVVAKPDGTIKGYVDNPHVDLPLRSDGKLDVGGAVGRDGYLSVIKDLNMKNPYIGKVPIQTGEIGDDLAYYFMKSEQVPSVVGLGVLVDGSSMIRKSGGFIVQVMPECDDKALSVLENRIANISSVTSMLESGMTPEDIIKFVMQDFEVDILESTPVEYSCDCSRERMQNAVASLGRKEIQAIIDEQGEAEVVCHFCNTKHKFSKSDLEELLDK